MTDAPKVHITYDVDQGPAIEKRELPFVIGVIGDFSGRGDGARSDGGVDDPSRAFIDVDRHSLDSIKARLAPALDWPGVAAIWRGLQHLVDSADSTPPVHWRLLDVTRQELCDAGRSGIIADHPLVRKAERMFDLTGSPLSLIVGDLSFDRSEESMALLRSLAAAAAALHAPLIAMPDPALFGLAGFADLHRPRALSKIFESIELQSLIDFRDSPDSRYVALALPSASLPGPDAENEVLPVNPAFLLAERIGHAFARFGWPAGFWGQDDGRVSIASIDADILPGRAAELGDLGFIPLVRSGDGWEAYFSGAGTVNRPKRYMSPETDINAAIASRLDAVLILSRFAHYLRAILRRHIGSFMTRANVEACLANWIASYVLLDEDAPPAIAAAYPLRAARITVSEVPGTPGAYSATLFLRPHFQIEELTASLETVVYLSA